MDSSGAGVPEQRPDRANLVRRASGERKAILLAKAGPSASRLPKEYVIPSRPKGGFFLERAGGLPVTAVRRCGLANRWGTWHTYK